MAECSPWIVGEVFITSSVTAAHQCCQFTIANITQTVTPFMFENMQCCQYAVKITRVRLSAVSWLCNAASMQSQSLELDYQQSAGYAMLPVCSHN